MQTPSAGGIEGEELSEGLGEAEVEPFAPRPLLWETWLRSRELEERWWKGEEEARRYLAVLKALLPSLKVIQEMLALGKGRFEKVSLLQWVLATIPSSHKLYLSITC